MKLHASQTRLDKRDDRHAGARKSTPGKGRSGGGKAGSGKSSQPAGPSQRQLRVAEEIRHVLSAVFARGGFRDPDLSDVSITVNEVRIGPDLKHATAFVSRLGRSDVADKLPALRRAAPFLRTQVARELRLKYAPDLHFQADTALDYAMYVAGLLRAPDVARDLASGLSREEDPVPDDTADETVHPSDPEQH